MIIPILATLSLVIGGGQWQNYRHDRLMTEKMKNNPDLEFKNPKVAQFNYDPEAKESAFEQYLDLCTEHPELAYVELAKHKYQRRQTVLFDFARFMNSISKSAELDDEFHAYGYNNMYVGFIHRDEHPSKNFPDQIAAKLMDPKNPLLIAAAYSQIRKAAENKDILNLGKYGFIKCSSVWEPDFTMQCTPISLREIYQEKISTGEISVRQCYQDHLPWSKHKHLNKIVIPTI